MADHLSANDPGIGPCPLLGRQKKDENGWLEAKDNPPGTRALGREDGLSRQISYRHRTQQFLSKFTSESQVAPFLYYYLVVPAVPDSASINNTVVSQSTANSFFAFGENLDRSAGGRERSAQPDGKAGSQLSPGLEDIFNVALSMLFWQRCGKSRQALVAHLHSH